MKNPTVARKKKRPTVKQLAGDVESLWNGMMYLDKNIMTMQKFFEEYLIMKDEVEPFMEHFEGRIEANGEIKANFFFNPCANGSKCYVQEEGEYNIAINDDKNITISGNIKTHKLTGEFTKGSGPDIVKIIFEIEAN